MIRAYLDTNLYISYLLKPNGSGPPSIVVRAGLQGEFKLLFGDPTSDEILLKAVSKSSLSKQITRSQVDALLEVLELVGEHIWSAPSVIPAISRDRKDDYLLTYSEAGNATHLVTGDQDLLQLRHDFDFEIVSPADFVQILDETNKS